MRDYNNGVTPRTRSYPKFCEVSPPKMRGVTPKNARRHPNACEESPRKWRDGPSPRMHYLAGPAPGANIVKKSSPWGPQYCAPDFNIEPLVA